MYNKIVLIGRLTRQVEVKKTSNGKSYCRFTLAVARQYKDSSHQEFTDFIPVVLWGSQAEHLISYTSKGSLLFIEGELHFRKDSSMNTEKAEVSGIRFVALESREARRLREGELTVLEI